MDTKNIDAEAPKGKATDDRDFYDLEEPIHGLAMAAQILATLFEDAEGEEVGDNRKYVLYDHEHSLLAFMIYDLCRRSKGLDDQFRATHKSLPAAGGAQ